MNDDRPTREDLAHWTHWVEKAEIHARHAEERLGEIIRIQEEHKFRELAQGIGPAPTPQQVMDREDTSELVTARIAAIVARTIADAHEKKVRAMQEKLAEQEILPMTPVTTTDTDKMPPWEHHLATLDQIRVEYPDPKQNRGQDNRSRDYSVGGALCRSIPRQPILKSFPSVATLALALARLNPRLDLDQQYHFAKYIAECNDAGNFEEAWWNAWKALVM